MEDVFTKKEGKLYEELKELSFQMMLEAASKLQIENVAVWDAKHNEGRQLYSAEELAKRHQKELLTSDKKSFALALLFEERLLSNGYKFNAFTNGPNVVQIWAENFLNKYRLQYPISWEFDYQDQNGLHYRYFTFERIEKNHEEFLSLVETLKVSEFEKERIAAIVNYYKESRKLLAKYINGEDLDEKAEKEHAK